MGVDVKVTGVQQVLKSFGKAKADVGRTIAESLEKCAGVVLRKSLGYVPVDTGALKASGHVETSGRGQGAESRVVYGGEDAHYALYVHEDLEKHHKPPTCAKFLERAARETRGTCASILRRDLKGRQVNTVDGQEVE